LLICGIFGSHFSFVISKICFLSGASVRPEMGLASTQIAMIVIDLGQ